MSRPFARIEDGVAQGARLEAAQYGGGQNHLTTMALIVQGGPDSWLLAIYADTGRGNTLLGRIRTLPWGNGERTVAICAHPGVRAWEVTGRRIAPVEEWPDGTPGDPPSLSPSRVLGVLMTATPRIGGPWGVTPMRGNAERAVDSLYVTGVAGGVVVRGNVLGWTAWNSNGVDGSLVIDAGSPILIPANGGFVQGGQVVYKGYGHWFNFAGTSSYRVDYERESPFENAGELP